MHSSSTYTLMYHTFTTKSTYARKQTDGEILLDTIRPIAIQQRSDATN